MKNSLGQAIKDMRAIRGIRSTSKMVTSIDRKKDELAYDTICDAIEEAILKDDKINDDRWPYEGMVECPLCGGTVYFKIEQYCDCKIRIINPAVKEEDFVFTSISCDRDHCYGFGEYVQICF